MMRIEKLHAAIAEICPIHGVNSNREISFKDEASPSQIEAAKLLAASWEDGGDLIVQQIEAIERSITPRRIREALLTDAGRGWLAEQDAAISALRHSV